MYVPEFFFTPNSTVEANQSSNLNLTCIVVGAPVPSVMWERLDGRSLHESANISFEKLNLAEAEFISLTLELYNVQELDSGLYSCNASNYLGSISHSVNVIVKGEHTLLWMALYF